MATPSKRCLKVADIVLRQLACLFKSSVSDPRLTGITLTHVDMSRDLSQASVYFTVLELDTAEQAVVVLNKASGHLRHQLSQTSALRYTPKLRFKLDNNLISANRINRLLNDNADHEHETD